MINAMKTTCCFIGHRDIENFSETKEKLKREICGLIERGVSRFIFGDHSAFNDLCYDTITELKQKYPYIERIKYRKDYQEISESVRIYFLEGFEDNTCHKGVAKAGKAAYVERNRAMITDSDICVFYYNENYQPKRRKESKRSVCTYQPKSGTRLAYEFAVRENKEIINLFGQGRDKEKVGF